MYSRRVAWEGGGRERRKALRVEGRWPGRRRGSGGAVACCRLRRAVPWRNMAGGAQGGEVDSGLGEVIREKSVVVEE